jgi:thiosulfate reductase cytochrome b subunit
MATYSGSLRSGLPRVEGGDPWPPAGTIGEALDEGASPLAEELETGSSAEVVDEEPTEAVADAEASDVVQDSTDSAEFADEDSDAEAGDAEADGAESVDAEVPLRRGLPRVVGGEPWPPEGFAPAGVKATGGSAAPAADSASEAASPEAGVEAAGEDSSSVAPVAAAATAGAGAAVGAAAASSDDDESAESAATDEPAAAESAAASAAASEVPLRRGLPRVAGGDPWPPEGYAPAGVKAAGATAAPVAAAAAPGSEGSEHPLPTRLTLLPRLLRQSPQEPALPGPRPLRADRAPVNSPMSRCVADFRAPPGETPGHRKASHRRVRPSRQQARPSPPQRRPRPRQHRPRRHRPKRPRLRRHRPKPASPQTKRSPPAPTRARRSHSADAQESAVSAPERRQVPLRPEPERQQVRRRSPTRRRGNPPSASPWANLPRSRRTSPPSANRWANPPRRPTDQPAQRKPMAKPAAKTADSPTAKPAPAAKSASSGSAGAASAKPAAKKEPVMIGSKSLGQWSKLVGLGLGGLIVAAGIIVLAARGVTTLPGVPEFLERYPGEYDIPEFVDPGFPGWVRWTHFLNIFFMVLIIRSGLQVRHQQKPPAFYTPKKGGKKVSINLWLHTSLDVLWLANGVIFVVLLFISGHWARIVPTSWEVFPNALSAMLQYMTLEWPMEDAWVNYNSLQQLMYFIIVFIAAPVAAITGVRMSEWWPKDAAKLNKIYPAPLARALHFPTMLFFVFFILVHVFLVFATGMRQNLGYMFAGTNVVGWAGLIWFIVAMVVVVAGWFAARPLLMAPIANLFGRVSSR